MFVFTMHKEGECSFPKQAFEMWALPQWEFASELVPHGGHISLGAHRALAEDSVSRGVFLHSLISCVAKFSSCREASGSWAPPWGRKGWGWRLLGASWSHCCWWSPQGNRMGNMDGRDKKVIITLWRCVRMYRKILMLKPGKLILAIKDRDRCPLDPWWSLPAHLEARVVSYGVRSLV